MIHAVCVADFDDERFGVGRWGGKTGKTAIISVDTEKREYRERKREREHEVLFIAHRLYLYSKLYNFTCCNVEFFYFFIFPIFIF